MQQLQPSKAKHTVKKPLPVAVRVLVSFLSCFFLILCVVAIGARKDWFQTTNTTGDADLSYVAATTASPEPSPVVSTSKPDTAVPETIAEEVTGSVAVLPYSTLRLGDDNSAVVALQMRLMELGYMDYDEPSSLFNDVTEMAVQLFQRALDRETTGKADNELQTMLYADDAQKYQVKLSDSGSDVRSIQLRLFELGYYDDKVSGYYGPRTEEAVMRFQTYNSLPVTGLFSYNTWQSLYSSSAVEAPVPVTQTPTPRPTPRPTRKATAKPSAASQQADAPSSAASDAVVTDAPSAADSSAPEATAAPTKVPASSSGGSKSYAQSVDGIVSCAQDQMGKPYIRGDEGPGSFDCSGLVYYCLRAAGVSVSRIKSTSYASKSGWTLIESIDALKKGDVICFKSDDSSTVNHVAICIGGGSFIHASSSKGKVVRSSFSSDASQYWNRNFVCGRRPIG